jgi:uncharacterized RDD family membrane protein YckC
MGMTGAFFALVSTMSVLYYIGSWALDGQTLGKMGVGVRVVAADGSPISLGTAILRFFGWMLSAAIVYLGFLMIAAKDKRGLHDMIAGTRVVRVGPARLGARADTERLRQGGSGSGTGPAGVLPERLKSDPVRARIKVSVPRLA